MSDAPSPSAPAPPRRPVRLVVNADDFGVSERVNSGIVHAHREGVVTATSLMAVGRAFEHAVRLARAVPDLDVGVHLTLVAERPLRPEGRSLTGTDGRFPPGAGAFTLGWLTGRIRRADVEAEWSAQIERVLASGIPAVPPRQPPARACPAGVARSGPGARLALRHPVRARSGGRVAPGSSDHLSRNLTPAGRRCPCASSPP